jgi:hypothetical protein
LRHANHHVGVIAALGLLLAIGACRPKATEAGDYRVARAPDAISLDAPDDPAWGRAGRVAWGPANGATVFGALWNDAGLFVRFDVTDEAPWHTKTRHDDKLWNEEVVEIFLQPPGASGAYGEVEISPGNVTCDVWVEPETRHFDLSWDLEGLESRVRARSGGWIATAFLPWPGLARAGRGAAPRPGDRWRFNVFRIERPKGPEHPEDGVLLLAWSPTGKPTFHAPEAFRGIVFD